MPERTLESLFPARVVAFIGGPGWAAFLTGRDERVQHWKNDVVDGQHKFPSLQHAKDAAKRIGAKLVKMDARLYRLEYR